MEKTDDTLVAVVSRLVDLGYAELPKILESSIQVTQLEGLFQALFGVVLVIGGIILVRKGNKFHKEGNDAEILFRSIGGMTIAVGSISLILGNLWLKILMPEAYIYKQLLFTTLD